MATVVAGAVLLAGCSSPRRQVGADETVTEERLGELRIGITAPVSVDPATLNPTRPMDVLAADLMFDGLTAVASGANEAAPAIATSWDTADGVTWTFHLDPDRNFSDGSSLTSAAAVASLERVRALSGSNLAAGRLAIVTAITAPDPATVQVVLDAPNYEFPALLADPSYGIVADAATAPTLSSQTAASGRFRVRSGGPDGATLVAFDGEDVGIDAVEFVRFDDAEAAGAALEDGSIDIAPLERGDDAPDGARTVDVSAVTLVLELGAANGVWADPANRQAVLHSLDRDAVAAAAGGRRADSVVPGDVVAAGGCSTWCVPTADGPAALATLGASSGAVPVDVPVKDGGVTAAAEIVRQLAATGLPATAREGDGAGLRATLAAGQMQLAVFVVVGGAPTPDSYLAATLSSIGAENLSGYASAEFDAGLAAARATADPVARRTAYEQLETGALATAPMIPLAAMGERFAVSDEVAGVVPLAGRLFDSTVVRIER